jgi:hypothetical protein
MILIYFLEKKSMRKYRIVFPKNRGGGVNFYFDPPFEIFPRKIFQGGTTPDLHPLAKLCF